MDAPDNWPVAIARSGEIVVRAQRAVSGGGKAIVYSLDHNWTPAAIVDACPAPPVESGVGWFNVYLAAPASAARSAWGERSIMDLIRDQAGTALDRTIKPTRQFRSLDAAIMYALAKARA